MSTEFHQLTLSSVEKITKDAVAIGFEVPDELRQEFSFKQGQHLTLKANIDGNEIRRSYSICNGVSESKLSVAIKRIEEGVFSNYANEQLSAGMALEVMPPQGHFYTELASDNKKNYLLLASGSGITPVLSQIISILHQEQNSKVTLVYGNRSANLMMFRDKLNFIKNAYLQRFQWINLFSREENDAVILNGRISSKKLVELDKARIIDLAAFDDVFVCGPQGMIEDVVDFLKFNQVNEDKIHYELFFVESDQSDARASQRERAVKFAGKSAKVSVKIAGRKTSMTLPFDGENILEAALENGADLPFSCKGGVCATCKAKVTKGKVEMDLNHSLTEQEVTDGMVLTCQSHPVSDEVEIDFDFS